MEDLLSKISDESNEIGIHINRKKTRIVKINSTYKYLQIKYTLTADGRIIKRINPTRVVEFKRKLKKLSVKVLNEEVDYKNVEQTFKSWMGSFYKILSREQRENIILLFENLYHKKITIKNSKLIIE